MLHSDDQAVAFHAKQKGLRKSRKFYAVGAAIAVFASTGAAYAAMTVFGSGEVTAEAGVAQNLTISEEKVSKKLYPGTVANVTFKVANPNEFPVKVTQVALDGAPTDVAPAGCVSKITSPLVKSGTAYNVPDAAQREVPAKGEAIVVLTNAVKLDNSATTGCGFSIKIKVTGTQSGAN